MARANSFKLGVGMGMTNLAEAGIEETEDDLHRTRTSSLISQLKIKLTKAE
jgi:hypothetical protein